MTGGGTNMTAGHYTQLALDFNRYCGEPWSVHAEQCSRYECQAVGGSWINRRWNFDNFGQSFMLLIELSTTEGWPVIQPLLRPWANFPAPSQT